MTDTPTTPVDLTLAKLSEEDLNFRRRKALQAIEKAKSKGQKTTDMERLYDALEAEANRRMRTRNLH